MSLFEDITLKNKPEKSTVDVAHRVGTQTVCLVARVPIRDGLLTLAKPIQPEVGPEIAVWQFTRLAAEDGEANLAAPQEIDIAVAEEAIKKRASEDIDTELVAEKWRRLAARGSLALHVLASDLAA